MNRTYLLLKDVNISEILMHKDGRSISIHFIDMLNGKPYANLEISSPCIFNYHNSFDDSDERMPVYIGEVTYMEIFRDQIASCLLSHGYRFKDSNGGMLIPKADRLFLIHLEGGEVSIDIICENHLLSDISMP